MKKIVLLSNLFIALSLTNSINAQNLSQGAVIIDGNILNSKDSIKCYKFKKLQIAFPITEQMFVHDKLVFTVTLNNTDTTVGQGNGFSYYVNLLKEDVISNFKNKKIGVITIVDENRTNVSLFADPIGELNKKEFYTIVGGAKLAFKPMLVEVSSMSIVSYQEQYVESSSSFVKYPIYGNSKAIFRKKVRFFNTIEEAKKTTGSNGGNSDSYSGNSVSGSLIHAISARSKKKKADSQEAAKENVKEDIKKDVVNGCNMPVGTSVNVQMNTEVDLDTFFGVITN